MPELPEVEVTCRCVRRELVGRGIKRVTVRNPHLRFPVPPEIARLEGTRVEAVDRRAKYILIRSGGQTAVIHLGMTGHLSFPDPAEPPGKHDHFDLALDDGRIMRYRDPRRFGALLWTDGDPMQMRILSSLGAEPLEPGFTGEYLHQRLARSRSPVKTALMKGDIVVGVGNIYASEVLYAAGISPLRRGDQVSLEECGILVGEIRRILEDSIARGGTTIRNYAQVDGSRGAFADCLKVYGRENENCPRCGGRIQRIVQGQRSTFYCSGCQR